MIKFRLSTILLLSNHPFIPMQAILFLTLIINQSQNYLINFNFLANQNLFKLIMCGWLHLDTMHADHAILIMRYVSIWWSNLETRHTVATVIISRSFLWYAMNKLMHVMQSWFLGYMNGHSSHSPQINHRWKIKCLQNALHWQSLESECQCKTKTLILAAVI